MGILDAPGLLNRDLPGANAARAGIDCTGATDATTALYNLLYLTKNVYFTGTIKVNGVAGTGFTPPNGCKLSGIRPTFTMNGTGGGTFSGGSVINGLINLAGCSGVMLARFGVNNPSGNAIQAVGGFSDILCDGLITNANNHNYLFEQFDADNTGAAQRGVHIYGAEMHGGPNGMAFKCRDVWVEDAIAHDIAVQCYVAVSDNIEAAATYNRAQNVTFMNCRVGLRCAQYGGRVYSRDCWSITNANGVQPAVNIRFLGGDYSGAGNHGIMIGDEVTLETTPISGSSAAGQTRLLSDVIIDANCQSNGWNGIRIASCGSVRIRGSVGNNGTAGTVGGVTYTNNNISADASGSLQQGGFAVQDMQISPDLVIKGAAVGLEIQTLTIPAATATVNVSARAQVYKTSNTGAFNLTAVTGAKLGQEFWIQIADNFSIVQLAANTPQFMGKDSWVKYRCIDTSGTIALIGGSEPLGAREVNRGYNASFSLNYTIGQQAQYVNLTGDITAITLFQPLVPLGHDGFSLRLIAGASTRALSGWPSSIKFPAAQFPSGAPSSVAANTTLLITFYWDGTYMVAKGSWIY
ncbi:hypothetical protein [Paraburkholderia dipogonis]|uniref:hypothetical protein n=1 Tax=Paraburkholderia dipogonis TaxID=1211383 RepID=UPI0038BBE891